MTKILITGGAGFIGSHIVDSLVKKGYEVIVYDNLSSGNLENLALSRDKIEFIKGDILDYETLKRAMSGCDYVSHHAAQLEIFLSISSPHEDLKQNTIGTLNVLMAAKENHIKKIINVSSACVYGQTKFASTENSPLNPNWAYGVSKLAAEKYAKIYNDYEGIPIISLRYGIVYGEREWYRRVLPIFLKQIILDKSPVIFGDGEQVRDFVYVKDLVKCHNLCLDNNEANGEVFNVGSGIPTSIKDLALCVCSLLPLSTSLSPTFEYVDEGQYSKLIPEKRRNSNELKMMLLDISKAKKILDWAPVTSLKDGLMNEYNWALNNLSRWGDIKYTK